MEDNFEPVAKRQQRSPASPSRVDPSGSPSRVDSYSPASPHWVDPARSPSRADSHSPASPSRIDPLGSPSRDDPWVAIEENAHRHRNYLMPVSPPENLLAADPPTSDDAWKQANAWAEAIPVAEGLWPMATSPFAGLYLALLRRECGLDGRVPPGFPIPDFEEPEALLFFRVQHWLVTHPKVAEPARSVMELPSPPPSPPRGSSATRSSPTPVFETPDQPTVAEPSLRAKGRMSGRFAQVDDLDDDIESDSDDSSSMMTRTIANSRKRCLGPTPDAARQLIFVD